MEICNASAMQFRKSTDDLSESSFLLDGIVLSKPPAGLRQDQRVDKSNCLPRLQLLHVPLLHSIIIKSIANVVQMPGWCRMMAASSLTPNRLYSSGCYPEAMSSLPAISFTEKTSKMHHDDVCPGCCLIKAPTCKQGRSRVLVPAASKEMPARKQWDCKDVAGCLIGLIPNKDQS